MVARRVVVVARAPSPHTQIAAHSILACSALLCSTGLLRCLRARRAHEALTRTRLYTLKSIKCIPRASAQQPGCCLCDVATADLGPAGSDERGMMCGKSGARACDSNVLRGQENRTLLCALHESNCVRSVCVQLSFAVLFAVAQTAFNNSRGSRTYVVCCG